MTTMLHRRGFLGLTLGVSAAAVLSACGDSGSAASGFPKRIRVGTMAPYVELSIMQRQKILGAELSAADQNATVEWKPLLSMVPMAQALAGGAIDFGHSAPPVSSIANGQKLSIVATFQKNVNGQGMLVAADSDIRKPSDLKGRTVGAPTTTPSLQLARILRAGGLTVDDITLKPLEANVGVSGLVNGAVDAYVSFDPYKTQAILDGQARELEVGEAKLQQYNPVVVNTDFLAKHPDAVEVYLRAMKKSIAWSNDPANAAKTAEIYAEVNKIDGALAAETLKNRTRELLVPNDEFRAQLEEESEFLLGQKAIRDLPDWDKAIDDKIVATVLKG